MKMTKDMRRGTKELAYEKAFRFTSGLENADYYFIPIRLAQIRKPLSHCS
jgi:hypothetical protein